MTDLAMILLTLLEALTAAAIAGGVALGLRGLRVLPGAERAGLVALFGVALAVRLRAPASPHDINFRSWGAYSEGLLDIERGFGLPALGRILHPFIVGWRTTDGWLFDVMAVVGATAPLALFAWLARRGPGRAIAWIAATLLAVATPHVRFSHTDAQQIPALTFGLIGLAAWADHSRRPSWTASVIAGAALAVAGCGRLELMAVPAAVALLALVDEAGVPWRHRGTWVALLGSAGVVLWHLYTMLSSNQTWDAAQYAGSGWSLVADHPLGQYGWRHLVVLDPAFTHPVLSLFVLAGVLVSALPAPTRLTLALLTFVLSVMVPTWSPVGAGAFAIARYQLAALPFAMTLAAGALAWVVSQVRRPHLRRIAPLLPACVAGLSATRLPVDWQPSTQSAEYAFIRAELPRLPAGCVLLYDEWPKDTGLAFPAHLIHMGGLPIEPVLTTRWTPDPARCTLYYRAATCSASSDPSSPAVAELPNCAGPGAAHPLTPIAEAALPRRQWVYDFYTTDPVRVGFYRVTP